MIRKDTSVLLILDHLEGIVMLSTASTTIRSKPTDLCAPYVCSITGLRVQSIYARFSSVHLETHSFTQHYSNAVARYPKPIFNLIDHVGSFKSGLCGDHLMVLQPSMLTTQLESSMPDTRLRFFNETHKSTS